MARKDNDGSGGNSKKKPAAKKGVNPASLENLKKCDRSNGFQKRPHDAGKPQTSQIKDFIAERIGRIPKKVEITTTCGMMLDLTMYEIDMLIERIEEGGEVPIIVGTIAKAIKADFAKGETDTIFKLMDHYKGRPKQAIELEQTLDVDRAAIENLSPEKFTLLQDALKELVKDNNQ